MAQQQQLPKGKLRQDLDRALLPGEAVLAWAQGQYDALIVATDTRVLLLKRGIASGAFFGRQSNSFPYAQITSVDLHSGPMQGHVQIGAAGTQDRQLAGNAGARMTAPNSILFLRGQAQAFEHVVAVIRQQLALYRQPDGAATRPVLAAEPSIPQQIERLAQLHAAGALSDAEFQTAKANLLRRI